MSVLVVTCAATYQSTVTPIKFGIDTQGGFAVRYQMDETYLKPWRDRSLVSDNDKLYLENAFPVFGVKDYEVIQDHLGMFTVTFPGRTIPAPKSPYLPELLLGIDDGRL